MPEHTRSEARTLGPGHFSVTTIASLFAGSTMPTPFYSEFTRDFGLSSVSMTLVFATYALSLLITLLTMGTLADQLGRRAVVRVSLVLSAIAMLTFLIADGLPELVIARLMQGVANGIALGALGATVLESLNTRGSLLNSVTPFIGLSAGALIGSVIIQASASPQPVAFGLGLAFFAVLGVFSGGLSRRTNGQPIRLRSFTPRLAIPKAARRTFLSITPANIAAWALGGYFFSLLPTLIQTALHIKSPLIGGGVVAVQSFAGAVTVLLLRRHPPRRNVAMGELLILIGSGSILIAVWAQITPLLLIGVLLAGAGAGASFLGASHQLFPLAADSERVGLLSAFYLQSYLAFSVPPLVVAAAVPAFGLAASTIAMSCVLTFIALVALLIRAVQYLRKPSTPVGRP